MLRLRHRVPDSRSHSLGVREKEMTIRPRKTPSEHQEQVNLVARVRLLYPDVIIYAIPNGGYRHLKEAVRLKAEGVLAGIPDLFIAEPRGGWHGLYVEVKKRNGKLSKDQALRIAELRLKGYCVLLADRGAGDALERVQRYLDLKS